VFSSLSDLHLSSRVLVKLTKSALRLRKDLSFSSESLLVTSTDSDNLLRYRKREREGERERERKGERGEITVSIKGQHYVKCYEQKQPTVANNN
jgi:uncharacterized membrane-anchored protein YhcB (DUF1043 family)